MALPSSRARWLVGLSIAFTAGLLFASSMDWTRLGFAQSKPDISATRSLTETGNAFVSIADHATPAVVSIHVEVKTRGQMRQIPPGFEDFFFDMPAPRRPSTRESSGSGFIVSSDGYILTNSHVVTGPDRKTVADKITVRLLDRRSFPAKVIGTDPTTDLAVIKIDGENLPTIPLGNDNTTRVGEWVVAVGNPLGLDFTVTAGIISAKGRSLPGLLGEQYAVSDLIQTDAAINPGNSGGPLLNTRGEVIGVNSAIASQTGVFAGYGFAIPITLAKKVMDELIAHGKVRIGILGVQIGEVNADDAAVAGLKSVGGALVQAFGPDNSSNPAKKAGIEPGDIIVKADDQDVDRVNSLQRIIRNHGPGETVKIEVMRFGERKTFNVTLIERPTETLQTASSGSVDNSQPSGAKLGVRLEALPDRSQVPASFPHEGVIVAEIEPLGPSHNKLAPNDVITGILYPESVAGKVTSVQSLQSALQKLKKGDYISLQVSSLVRDGSIVNRVVNVQLGG